ncbi:MAG: hypothetical protein A3B86_03930 [Candidatus Yanofskybacteria bacterium RIFCSPHIGHO2_02_FULL_38_22b]|uniref:Uncharacterized protein n=1 Tax=Candidatus Yanofskybacteria bacterium RIFCSPHIGHO2_02_FULL_38_22b TaxID=1802673 RepID=A0A1F8F0Y5_9BACT|nr:MAG: hypothetical protein A2816_01700 [Candidatus Yanofskybacteria bacterium RIFCSPHIGHO2_01_FULL_39_44]OGN06240.1 MAG: hypothetical protein A3B86_03930 [Candidatus Yanofskybacteria bacterium RIFCSPHIGHO2_02_FULL_38_22b]OGN19660.1 MAG: hypothetical protein A2910_03665 [Candidatus Yanofskybacteria bacterium RIFCSPLOWO2_01_FULL_39_28]
MIWFCLIVHIKNINNILLDDEQTFVKKIPELCKSAESLNNKDVESQCVSAIGEGIMFYTGHNLEKSKKICLILPAKNQRQCLEGAEIEFRTNKSLIE